MSKHRYIDTKFWNDSFVIELNPLDRYLFLYLLTNEHTNIAGVYELPIIRMAQETGIDKEMLPKMMKRLSDKIRHVDGWIVIKNFQKHQQKRGEKIKQGIDNIMSEIPDKIRAFHAKWVKTKDTPSYPIDSLSIEPELLDSNRDSNRDTIPSSTDGGEINEIISLFKEVNPSIGKYYARKHERQAVARMLKEHGRVELEKMIKVLPQVNAQPYWPKSITPLELENNLGKYKALKQSEKNKHIKNTVPLI